MREDGVTVGDYVGLSGHCGVPCIHWVHLIICYEQSNSAQFVLKSTQMLVKGHVNSTIREIRFLVDKNHETSVHSFIVYIVYIATFSLLKKYFIFIYI